LCDDRVITSHSFNETSAAGQAFLSVGVIMRQKEFTIVLAMLVLSAICFAGPKKFSENINRSLFSDRRAYQVGDVVTILIVEHAVGSNEAGTSSDVQNDLGCRPWVRETFPRLTWDERPVEE